MLVFDVCRFLIQLDSKDRPTHSVSFDITIDEFTSTSIHRDCSRAVHYPIGNNGL